MILYLYPKHNYYNRKSIRYETVDEYTVALGSTPYIAANVNFIANEGVRTSQIINYDFTAPEGYADGTAAPSYCLVCDVDSNILHRWWIVESRLKCYGQVQLQLLRDVLADFRQEVLNCPSFIKKGWINTPNDTAIFNNEDMTYNQIKTSEMLLPDRSGTPWYIGYLTKEDIDGRSFDIQGQPLNIAQSYDSFADYPYYKYNVDNPFKMDYAEFICSTFIYVNYGANYQIGWDEDGNLKDPIARDGWYKSQLVNIEGVLARDDVSNNVGFRYSGKNIIDTVPKIQKHARATGGWGDRAKSLLGIQSQSAVSAIQNENGKIYMIAGTPYRVRLTSTTIQQLVEVPNGNVFALSVKSMMNQVGDVQTTQNIKGTFTNIWYSAIATVVNLDKVPEEEYSLSFELPGNRIHTEDLPFDIIAIPAKRIEGDVGNFVNNESLAKIITNAIIAQLPKTDGAALLYDFQLLPYCPLPDEMFYGDGTLKLTNILNTEATTNYTMIETTGGEQTIILYLRNAEVNKTILAPEKQISVPMTAKEYKIANETDMYRLVSPNYNGQFEFSATGNGGVQGWNISLTCKPYNPYIRVSPIFGRLYGKDFGDARGLVCGGDFSLSQTNDAWETYQLQNKNYQTIFDRQIENMKVNNAIQKQKEGVEVIAGALSAGGTVGGAAGYIGGLGPGLAAGGIASALSTGAGMIDIRLNDKLRAEALDYAKDQFGYQLQNIQALPYSLTKVGAQNINYKDFPFVEYYTCSAVEKNALIDKIEYDGMTIMRIGYISNFLKNEESTIGTYIQAKPIRLDGIAEDSYIVDVIAAELQTGVYII